MIFIHSMKRVRCLMGYYITIGDELLADFLAQKATSLNEIIEWKNIPEGTLPVFVLDFGHLQTANIAHHQKEYAHLLRLKDERLSKMYLAHIENLVPFGSMGFSEYVLKHNLGKVPQESIPEKK